MAALAQHAYDGIGDGATFAQRLTADLRAVTHDVHMRVFFSREQSALPGFDVAAFRLMLKRTNAGFERIDHLRGNIGYLKLQGFTPMPVFSPRADAAMRVLADTDALIIDLRENNGGGADSVAYLASFLFDSGNRVHLNDLHWREQPVQEFWTTPVPSTYLQKPVFVLTSKKTASAAEGFSYDMKVQQLATIVGETTAGGANPGGITLLDGHFSIFIPGGYAENPVTKSNWEGTGVVPDIAVDADGALKTAAVAALKRLIESTSDPAWRTQLTSIVAEVEANGDGALFQASR